MHILSALLVSFFLISAVNAQNLPSYLEGHYPVAGATGVPRNTALAVQIRQPFQLPYDSVRLREKSGAEVPLTQVWIFSNTLHIDLVVKPTVLLAPATTYVATLSSRALSWSWEFTTGSAQDTTPPRLLSVSPALTGSGVSPIGPFVYRFDKALLIPNRAAAVVSDGSGYLSSSQHSLSADRRSLEVRLAPTQSVLPVIQIAFDPTKTFRYGRQPRRRPHHELPLDNSRLETGTPVSPAGTVPGLR